MAGTVVTDEWVTKTFGVLKNGLYIIFRVEEKDIQDGFILKHYGVTGDNDDKLNLDDHGIVKSTNLEKLKIIIDSNTLKLGIKENSNLSGMGFVKKDTGIRAFVDVTDGTDTKNIRNKLDNESTINNFFNHNIYDWFIKKKIRQHIKGANGDSDEDYEDDFECDITQLKEAYKIQIDNQLINVLDDLLKNAKDDDFGRILNTFIVNNTENKGLINKIVDIFKIIQEKNSKNILDVTKPSPNIGEIADMLKDINVKIQTMKGRPYEEALNNLEKDNLYEILMDLHNSTSDTVIQDNISELQNTLNSVPNIDIANLDTAKQDEFDMSTIENNYQIKLGGGYIEGKEAIDYNDEIHITLDDPCKNIEKNIEKITKLFNGEFRYILSLHTSYTTDKGGTFVTYWRQWITTLQKKLTIITIEKLYEDLLPFLFVDASYQNKMRTQVSSQGNMDKYEKQFTLMNDSENGIIDSHPYYTNNANHLIQDFFQVTKNVEINKVKGKLQDHVKNMKVIHIADLIQIYNRMKKYTPYSKRQNEEISFKFETITKSIANYFRDLGEESGGSATKNVWWENIDNINNLCQAVNTQLGLKKNINLINDSKLMTFVKINNYSTYDNKLDLKRWNITYTPYISKKNNSFLKLTVKNYDRSTATNQKKNFQFPTSQANQVDSRTYIFGGFSHVFKPNQELNSNDDDNEQVDEIKEMINTDQTTNIINKITQTPNPEKVFIFGYGASGAGKTAMLVYNNKKKKDGYCIHLCKEIAKEILKKNNNRGTVKLTLNIHEFDKNYRHNSDKTYFNTKEFTYTPGSMKGGENKEMGSLIDSRAQSKTLQEGGELTKEDEKRMRVGLISDPYSVYIQDKNNVNLYKSEAKSKIDEKIKEEFNSNEFIDNNNIPLVFYIREYVTDESKSGKRKIKPTRNNDQSSRSHVIIFLDFKYNNGNGTDTDYGSLIIADLAGVENPFDPFDPDTIIETHKKIKDEIEKIKDKELEECIYNVKSSISLKGTVDSRKALIKHFTTNEYIPDLNADTGIIKFEDYSAKVDNYRFDDSILEPEKKENNVDLSIKNNVDMIYEIIKNEYGNGHLDSYFDKKKEDNNNRKLNVELEIKTNNLSREIKVLKNTIDSDIIGNRKVWVNYLDKFKDKDKILNQEYAGNSQDQWLLAGSDSTDTIWPQRLQSKWSKEKGEENHYKNKKSLKTKEDELESLRNKYKSQKQVKDSNLENELYHFYYENTDYHAESNISPQHDKLFYFYYTNKGDKSNKLSLNITKPENIDNIKSFLKIEDDITAKIVISQNPNTLGQITINWSYVLTSDKKTEYQKKFLEDFAQKNTDILNTLEYDNNSYPNNTEMSTFITDIIFTETNYEDKETAEHYRNEVIKFCQKIPKHSKFDQDKQNKIRKRKQYELQYIMSEVKDRYEEGLYINDQLKLLRKNMFDAMYHKCDGFLFTAPNINETCASSLCVPNDNKTNNCYLMETKKITSVVGNNGITDIFVKMQSTYNYSNTSEMLKKLNILVFTVFNITEKETKVDEKGIQNPFNDDINNKLYSYLEPTQFIDIEEITETTYLSKIKNMFTDNKTKNSQHTSVKESAIRDGLKNDINQKEYSNIIEKLNTHNASTPLGTLFFTDNMSKFGKNSICHTQNNKDDFNFVLDYVYQSEDRKNNFKRKIEGSESKDDHESKDVSKDDHKSKDVSKDDHKSKEDKLASDMAKYGFH